MLLFFFGSSAPPVATPVPAATTFADQLYAELEPIGSEDLRTLCRAVGVGWQDLHEIVRDTDAGPGWSTLLDVDRAPAWALAWLAQMVGVRVTRGASETVQRAEVRTAAGAARGTPASLVAAVQATLTGTRRVILRERYGSPYRVRVETISAETPDPVAAEAAARAQKPAGLVLEFATITGQTWDSLGASVWDSQSGKVWNERANV